MDLISPRSRCILLQMISCTVFLFCSECFPKAGSYNETVLFAMESICDAICLMKVSVECIGLSPALEDLKLWRNVLVRGYLK